MPSGGSKKIRLRHIEQDTSFLVYAYYDNIFSENINTIKKSVYAYYDNIFSENINTIKKSKDALLEISRKVGLKVNMEKTEVYGYVSPQNAPQFADC
jgi:hypothetical protein